MRTLIFALSVLILFLPGCSGKTEEIRVKDFGAIPGDGKDDTPSILSAVEACRNKKNVKLVFEPGGYDISGSRKDVRGNLEPSIVINDINNLSIEGNEAEFTGHSYSSMFHFLNCTHLSVSNLKIDWDPLPYSQGKVIRVDSSFIDIEVLAPSVARAGLHTQAILGYDPVKRRMARRFTDHYQLAFEKTTEVIGPGIMRLFIGRQDRFAGTMPEVGMYIIARHQVYDYQSFEFEKCTDVNMENVTIYSNPGMGVTGDQSRDINISHLKIMIKPGSGRWMSCTADATNFTGCRGTIVMENCLFEGQGDDATNVNSGHYLLVAGRTDENKLRIKTGYKYGDDLTAPKIGDKIELSGDDRPMLPYATLTVSSVETDENGKALLVGFSEKLPERTKQGDIAGNASSCPALRIRNCTAIRNRARGFIIKTRDVIIEDCTFQDICASAIGLEADVNAWWESIGSRNVLIRHNRFIDCRFENEYLQGVIESHTMSQTAPAGVHKNITIENNIFLGSAGNTIKLGSADSVVIQNNIIDQPVNEAILLYNSSNILIKENKFTNCRIQLKIGDGCDTSTIRTENNEGFR